MSAICTRRPSLWTLSLVHAICRNPKKAVHCSLMMLSHAQADQQTMLDCTVPCPIMEAPQHNDFGIVDVRHTMLLNLRPVHPCNRAIQSLCPCKY